MAKVSEKSFPFDSEQIDGEFDREYLADDFARYFRAFISSGTFMREPTNLQVIANSDMSVTLKAGSLMIDGYRYDNIADIKINVDPADGVYNRIDRVVVTWDKESRDIHAELRKGKSAYTPVAPECRRTVEYKDYAVADIYVAAGVIKITQSAITDQRLNTKVCGLATPFVELDLSTIMTQIQSYQAETIKDVEAWKKEQKAETDAWQQKQITQLAEWITALKEDNTEACELVINTLEQFEADAEQQFENWYETNTASWGTKFNAWFENLKAQLTDNVASNLQNQIDATNEELKKTTELAALNKQTLGYGKKNLLKVTVATQTIRGITFTVNSDGSVTAKGTNNNTSGAIIFIAGTVKLKKGSYIVSGCPKNGQSNSYRIDLRYGSTYEKILTGVYDFGNGATFTLTEEMELACCVRIEGSTTYDNLTFYPMIRSADIEDGTYEPYVDDVDTRIESLTSSVGKMVSSELNGREFSTLQAFVEATASDITHGHMFRFKDTGGWGPLKKVNQWYRCEVQYQNSYKQSQYGVNGTATFDMESNGGSWRGKIEGNYSTGVTSDWKVRLDSSHTLNTLEEITANTKTEMITGALATKQIINNMGGLRFGVDKDGNYGYYKDGADTVTPFKSSNVAPIKSIKNIYSSVGRVTTTNIEYDTTKHKSLSISGVSNATSNSTGNAIVLKINGTTSTTTETLAEYTGEFSATLDITNYDSVTIAIPASSGVAIVTTIAEITSIEFS